MRKIDDIIRINLNFRTVSITINTKKGMAMCFVLEVSGSVEYGLSELLLAVKGFLTF